MNLPAGITPAGSGKAAPSTDATWSVLGDTYWLKAESGDYVLRDSARFNTDAVARTSDFAVKISALKDSRTTFATRGNWPGHLKPITRRSSWNLKSSSYCPR